MHGIQREVFRSVGCVRYARAPWGKRGQHGAFAIMSVPLIFLMLVLWGFAMNLSMAYNRKAELQTVADALAMAAAKKLDGTSTGIDNAVSFAKTLLAQLTYGYSPAGIEWSDDAISFGTSPTANDWLPSAGAKLSAANRTFAKIDTSKFSEALGKIPFVIPLLVLKDRPAPLISARAIAGRSTIKVTPLAVCAMSPPPQQSRGTGNESVEYGFRRGISYDLMNLNPIGSTPARYLVNPIAPPGTKGDSVASNLALIRPFMCTGTMAVPKVMGATITIEALNASSPLGNVYQQLNSRFGTGPANSCNSTTAPPDTNTQQFIPSAINWMMDTPQQSAESRTTTGSPKQLLTLADLPLVDTPPAPTTQPAMYGPLWISAKPVNTSGTIFSATTANWTTLYPKGTPRLKSPSQYPAAGTPYDAGIPTNASVIGNRRRVLNIPLLDCQTSLPSGTPGTATVVAIAKFFMTVEATDKALVAEFAGLTPEPSVGGQVELY